MEEKKITGRIHSPGPQSDDERQMQHERARHILRHPIRIEELGRPRDRCRHPKRHVRDNRAQIRSPRASNTRTTSSPCCPLQCGPGPAASKDSLALTLASLSRRMRARAPLGTRRRHILLAPVWTEIGFGPDEG